MFYDHAFWIAMMMTVLAASATMLGGLSIVRTHDSNPRVLAFGLSFAGGAMVYISLVEIFVKSQTSFGQIYPDKIAYSLATVAFFAGVLMLVLLDRFLPNPHVELKADHYDEHTISKDHVWSVGLLATLAITAHNFPEGMATFFSTYDNPTVGATLAFAIAIHNIPEGISIAIPIYYATGSKKKAMLATFISAIAEPVGALLGFIVLQPFIGPGVYGCVFGMIAGAMVYLSLDELLPAAKRYAKGHETVYGMILGMMIIALSLAMFR
jgi:zinc transporter, ZIP family